MKERVEITISPSGEIKVEAKGFKGKSCLAATKELLEKLGGKQEFKKKPEWYQEEKKVSYRYHYQS